MNERFIITIVSEDKNGLLSQITALLNRKSVTVVSLNLSRTDIRNMLLITLEVLTTEQDLHVVLNKLERIIEVYKATACSSDDFVIRKVAFFMMSNKIVNSDIWLIIQKYGVVITTVMEDSFILEKSGSEEDISELYNKLDGEYLLSFCKSGLISEKCMVQLGDIYVEQ